MCSSKLAAARLRLGTLCAPMLLSLLSLPPASAGTTPAISGTPPTSGVMGQAYSFTPSATGPSGETLRFTILDRPSWASFSATTGQLSGTPTIGGDYSDIVIGVTNGETRAALPAFSITVSKATSTAPSGTNSGAPTISGKPPTTGVMGEPYSFTPSATGPSGETLRFTILDKPSWATFSATTGQLSGTPTVGGSYSNIEIGVTDGTTRASLAAFTITVSASTASELPPGAVTISWTPPTENANGSTLTNLAGYHLYYGTSQSNLNKVVDITNPGLASYSVDDLSAGTWYFALTSVNSQGVESVRSPITSATVQ